MSVKTEFTFDDVLLLPQHSTLESRLDPDTTVVIKDRKVSPIIVANMETTGTARMAKALGHLSVIVPIHRFCSIEDQIKEIIEVKESKECEYLSVTLGIKDDKRRDAVLEYTPDFVFLDLAHADTSAVQEELAVIRRRVGPETCIVVGNVVTRQAVERLTHIDGQADIIKCGTGSGSICSTRLTTGCGRPQLSAIMDCAKARLSTVPIIADGGIRYPGDTVKALAAGATFVMSGRLYAGTTEAAGEYSLDGYKMYRGLASKEAQEALAGAMKPGVVPEGIQTRVARQGSAVDVTEHLLAAIRQGMSMLGARNLLELREAAQFVQVSPNTVIENNAY